MNFTGVYERYPFLRRPAVHWLDCTQVEGTNCYCDAEAEERLRQLIAPISVEGIHFLDSGNYHYMTKLWTDKIEEDFNLALFDHHTDTRAPQFGNLLSCGGWVRTMLEQNPRLQKVFFYGISPEALDELNPFADRVEAWTYEELTQVDWGYANVIAKDNGGYPMYLSIDRDVLSPEHAVTNWDQGDMAFEILAALLFFIMSFNKIIGADVCGEEPMEEEAFLERYGEDLCRRNKFVNYYLMNLGDMYASLSHKTHKKDVN